MGSEFGNTIFYSRPLRRLPQILRFRALTPFFFP